MRAICVAFVIHVTVVDKADAGRSAGPLQEQIQVRDRRKPHLQELEQNNLAILEEMERLTMSGGVTHNTPVLEGLLEKNGRFDLLLQVTHRIMCSSTRGSA